MKLDQLKPGDRVAVDGMNGTFEVLSNNTLAQRVVVQDAEGLAIPIPWDVIVPIVAPTLLQILGDALKGLAARVKRWAGRGDA